jgi:2,4-dienoyl-CoA reductase-like NADH-dependent reductase (Old Yellow Enzyme family)
LTTPSERNGVQPLLRPYRAGDYPLANRLVMAPMTRSRATNPDLAPTELHAQYYAQRASAGLIVTEGSFGTPARCPIPISSPACHRWPRRRSTPG